MKLSYGYGSSDRIFPKFDTLYPVGVAIALFG